LWGLFYPFKSGDSNFMKDCNHGSRVWSCQKQVKNASYSPCTRFSPCLWYDWRNRAQKNWKRVMFETWTLEHRDSTGCHKLTKRIIRVIVKIQTCSEKHLEGMNERGRMSWRTRNDPLLWTSYKNIEKVQNRGDPRARFKFSNTSRLSRWSSYFSVVRLFDWRVYVFHASFPHKSLVHRARDETFLNDCKV
jgi:hypothetical protein